MRENELCVIFSPEFLEDIEELGNSVTISDYSIEDLRGEIKNIADILEPNFPIYPYHPNEILPAVGYWDPDLGELGELKTHISLPDGLFSNKVTLDDETFEINRTSGDGLVRIIRFNYTSTKRGTITAFAITGEISKDFWGNIIIDPIKCDQSRIILTITDFPRLPKANIEIATIEKDTEFLEGPGVYRGTNIFRETTQNLPGTRQSSRKYLDYTESRTDITKKSVPYIDSDGKAVYRRDCTRIYTEAEVYCSGLIKNITPRTRASLNRDGGILRIYGTVWYKEYENTGNELVYVGEGTESLDGIPDSKLILTLHDNGLKDPEVSKFIVSYGRYEGQSDPSVLCKARIEFWNPFIGGVSVVESENIKLTQEENVIPQWDNISGSTEYIEPTGGQEIPVYVFPWQSGYTHTFTLRTTLPNLNIERDFYLEYEDRILETYFDIQIERIGNRTYPITDYKVSITSKTNNTDPLRWLPIINGRSELKLTTLRVRDYDYSQSFYFVQSAKPETIELHDSNNNNIQEIVLEYNQTRAEFFPVATEASTVEEIGERNTWKILEISRRLSPDSFSGRINPNSPDSLRSMLSFTSSEIPEAVGDIDLGNIVLGRIKESEVGNDFSDVTEWRNDVALSTVTIPVKKRGIIEHIGSDNLIVLKEINLYKIKVTCNGPFACWMNESQDYCFFDPGTNKPTYTNYYYSQDFNNTTGVYVWIALHHTVALNSDPTPENQILFTVTPREPDWSNGKPDIFNDPSNISECTVYRQAPEIELDYLDPKDCYVLLGPYEETTLKFKSTETPSIDRLQILENSRITQQNDTFNPSSNSVTLIGQPTPEYTISELYKYHIQSLQNPNDLYDYYPISPSCIYRAHSYNYPDIKKEFYIFKKALGPSFYRSDSSRGNVMYMVPDPQSVSTNKVKQLVIRSRYEIRDSEFTTEFDVSNSFEIRSITHVYLNTNDYKHQYSILLEPTVTNTGGQRSLGSLVITSRIYNLINFASTESVVIPYVELEQSDIDEIVPPATMRISIIQEAGNGGNTGEIKVVGNRESQISNSGESRSFTISSSMPIQMPEITNILGCSVSRVSTSGFTFTVDSIIAGYRPVTPSGTSSYTSYVGGKDISFDLVINPTDTLSYQSYSESFSFRQGGIYEGLVYASSSNTPKLYLGSNNIVEDVSPQTTSLSILLGAFSIGSQIESGSIGSMRGVAIETSNSYRVVSNTCTYLDTGWKGNVILEFPENTTSKPINRIFTITYNDSGMIHKITITVRQASSGGTIVCSDQAYFLSHGECIETDDYSDNMGFFTFDTDIPIKSLSLGIPKSLIDEDYNFTYVGPSSLGGSYKTYKAYIKLKPNLSDSVIEKQIFNFLKNGSEVIRSVYINQGYYCLTVCDPKSTTTGVYSGGTLGSEKNPITVPSRNNLTLGDRKVFKLILQRSEPLPESGRYVEELLDMKSDVYFPEVINYTWKFNGPDIPLNISGDIDSDDEEEEIRNKGSQPEVINIDSVDPKITEGGYITSYQTELFQSDDKISSDYIPFLENIYTVYPKYYTTEIGIRVDTDILVQYPYTDPLYTFKKTTTHSYTFYLSKQGEKI